MVEGVVVGVRPMFGGVVVPPVPTPGDVVVPPPVVGGVDVPWPTARLTASKPPQMDRTSFEIVREGNIVPP